MSAQTIDTARAAKTAASDAISKFAHVVGSGITKVGGEYAVKVNITEAPASGTKLPTEINGVRIVVEVVGPIRKSSGPRR